MTQDISSVRQHQELEPPYACVNPAWTYNPPYEEIGVPSGDGDTVLASKSTNRDVYEPRMRQQPAVYTMSDSDNVPQPNAITPSALTHPPHIITNDSTSQKRPRSLELEAEPGEDTNIMDLTAPDSNWPTKRQRVIYHSPMEMRTVLSSRPTVESGFRGGTIDLTEPEFGRPRERREKPIDTSLPTSQVESQALGTDSKAAIVVKQIKALRDTTTVSSRCTKSISSGAFPWDHATRVSLYMMGKDFYMTRKTRAHVFDEVWGDWMRAKGLEDKIGTAKWHDNIGSQYGDRDRVDRAQNWREVQMAPDTQEEKNLRTKLREQIQAALKMAEVEEV